MRDTLTIDQADGTLKTLEQTDWASIDLIEWLEDVLSIEVTGKRSLDGDWVIYGYELLLGWGGPNITLKLDRDGWGTLEVYWAGDKEVRQVGWMPELVDVLNELESM